MPGAMRMGGLIDDLLRLSRIGRWEMNRQDFDLSSLATSAAAEAAEAYPGHRVEVAVEPGMRANGDPGLVHTILENLLGNAWKFSSRTDGRAVEVGRQVRDGRACVFRPGQWRGLQHGIRRQTVQALSAAASSGRIRRDWNRPEHRAARGRAPRRRVWAESEEDRGATFWFTLGKPAAARAP